MKILDMEKEYCRKRVNKLLKGVEVLVNAFL